MERYIRTESCKYPRPSCRRGVFAEFRTDKIVQSCLAIVRYEYNPNIFGGSRKKKLKKEIRSQWKTRVVYYIDRPGRYHVQSSVTTRFLAVINLGN